MTITERGRVLVRVREDLTPTTFTLDYFTHLVGSEFVVNDPDAPIDVGRVVDAAPTDDGEAVLLTLEVPDPPRPAVTRWP